MRNGSEGGDELEMMRVDVADDYVTRAGDDVKKVADDYAVTDWSPSGGIDDSLCYLLLMAAGEDEDEEMTVDDG